MIVLDMESGVVTQDDGRGVEISAGRKEQRTDGQVLNGVRVEECVS